jgi:hypothetical protein
MRKISPKRCFRREELLLQMLPDVVQRDRHTGLIDGQENLFKKSAAF